MFGHESCWRIAQLHMAEPLVHLNVSFPQARNPGCVPPTRYLDPISKYHFRCASADNGCSELPAGEKIIGHVRQLAREMGGNANLAATPRPSNAQDTGRRHLPTTPEPDKIS